MTVSRNGAEPRRVRRGSLRGARRRRRLAGGGAELLPAPQVALALRSRRSSSQPSSSTSTHRLFVCLLAWCASSKQPTPNINATMTGMGGAPSTSSPKMSAERTTTTTLRPTATSNQSHSTMPDGSARSAGGWSAPIVLSIFGRGFLFHSRSPQPFGLAGSRRASSFCSLELGLACSLFTCGGWPRVVRNRIIDQQSC